jgi:hypothetical protein
MSFKVTKRGITPVKGDVRYECVNAEGEQVVCFLSGVQINTLTALGEKAPKVGDTVFVTVSDQKGRGGETYGQLDL